MRNLQDRFPYAHLIGADNDYEALIARVVGFVEAPELAWTFLSTSRGTAFQRRVWRKKALQHIPVGGQASYAEIGPTYRMPEGCSGSPRQHAPRTISPLRHSLPPRGPQGRFPFGLCLGG